jgi:hypothetical protein
MKSTQSVQFIQTTPTELKIEILEGVNKQFEDFKKHFCKTSEPAEYYTRKDLAKLFQVDLSTIHNWTKKGIIVANQIGGRIYYERKHIENALVKLKN